MMMNDKYDDEKKERRRRRKEEEKKNGFVCSLVVVQQRIIRFINNTILFILVRRYQTKKPYYKIKCINSYNNIMFPDRSSSAIDLGSPYRGLLFHIIKSNQTSGL